MPAATAINEPAHAHGIDVSSHQAGINIPALWADFVIVKATEDDDYTNPHMNTQATGTLNAGKRLGFYHFARPGNATTQAHYFVNTIRPYVSRATLWLDWEADAPAQGPGWAKTWLDTVASLTGTTPGIYMNGSTVNGYNWTSVAAKYPLWYAGGPNYSSWGKSYTDPAIPSLRYWGQPLIHQYTEDGRLPGYGGKLDLNRLRDRTTWDTMKGTGPQANERTDGYGVIPVNGQWTTRTAQRFRRVMNAWDYPEFFAVANLARYLNSAVPAASINTLIGKDQLPTDGAWTSDIYKVFQYWAWNWVPGMPECDVWQRFARGWTFNQFVDGVWGPATCAVFQEALNRSWANTGRLMAKP